MAKKKKEIRDMSKDQLIDHVEALKKELFNPVSYTHLTLPTKA